METTVRPLVIVGVDQSLASSGMVLVKVDPTRAFLSEDPTSVSGTECVQVLWKGLLASAIAIEGSANIIERGVTLIDAFESHLIHLRSTAKMQGDYLHAIIYETPPSANRMQRPESSLVAAVALCYAAKRLNIDTIAFSANSAKRFFTGYANAKKSAVKERLLEMYPHIVEDRLNEHQMDALALVIASTMPKPALAASA